MTNTQIAMTVIYFMWTLWVYSVGTKVATDINAELTPIGIIAVFIWFLASLVALSALLFP